MSETHTQPDTKHTGTSEDTTAAQDSTAAAPSAAPARGTGEREPDASEVGPEVTQEVGPRRSDDVPVVGPPTGSGELVPVRDSLSSAGLLRPAKHPPRSGWRAALYTASGGTLNLGESAADAARRELASRVNQRLIGSYRLVTMSLKGGVGKSSMTACLGATFASLRGDRVLALDANPDRGNLAEKIPTETTATVRHLLRDAPEIHTASDIRAYTSQGPSRLEVLASEQDPESSKAYDAAEFHRTIDLLSAFYSILLTDAGTGILHSALQAAIGVADSLLIVSSASIDGARAAKATIEWLEAHGHSDLVARSITVINGVRPRPGNTDLDAVERYFSSHTRECIRVPFDRHLDEGGEIDLERLSGRTRDALLTLAAVVADDFPRTSRYSGGGNARRTPAVLPGASRPAGW